MDILIGVVLPLSLAIIMLSLGVGLTTQDFTRILQQKRAFATGAGAQIVLIPVAAYLVVQGFGFSGELAVGIMLLAFCPGGVTSNMISKLSKGDVALSVSLTAVVSLLSILTVPVLAAWSVTHFMGQDAPNVSVAGLSLAVFLITTLPVALGVALRHFAEAMADRIEPALSKLATGLFVVIVLAALAGNWDVFIETLPVLGPALVTLIAALLVLGLLAAKGAGLNWKDCKTISVEAGIQNATLAIALGTLITGQSGGFSAMELPAAAYGILMYFVALPFILFYRSRP